MKFYALVFLTLGMCLRTAGAAETTREYTRRDALKAIATFNETPVSRLGKEASAIILDFAEKSESVDVLITLVATPWMSGDDEENLNDTLLVAYVAGNVKSQLDRGVTSNDSYAGVRQVLKTYAQLQKQNKGFRVAAVEKFKELEEKKGLKKYLDDAIRKERESAPDLRDSPFLQKAHFKNG